MPAISPMHKRGDLIAGMARAYKKASSTTVGAGHACEQNPSTGVATFRGH